MALAEGADVEESQSLVALEELEARISPIHRAGGQPCLGVDSPFSLLPHHKQPRLCSLSLTLRWDADGYLMMRQKMQDIFAGRLELLEDGWRGIIDGRREKDRLGRDRRRGRLKLSWLGAGELDQGIQRQKVTPPAGLDMQRCGGI